jgi:hypothetical protein
MLQRQTDMERNKGALGIRTRESRYNAETSGPEVI